MYFKALLSYHFLIAERECLDYFHIHNSTCYGMLHTIQWDNIFNVIEIYCSNMEVVCQFFWWMCYWHWRGSRRYATNQCSAWENAYLKMFDGEASLISAVHHQVETEKFPVLSAIISHGYRIRSNFWMTLFTKILKTESIFRK